MDSQLSELLKKVCDNNRLLNLSSSSATVSLLCICIYVHRDQDLICDKML